MVFPILGVIAIDPLETVTSAEPDDPAGTPFSKLNPCVATTVAPLATFMGICKIKDDNFVQAMQQAQAQADSSQR